MKKKIFLLILIFNFSCSTVKFTNEYLTYDYDEIKLNFTDEKKKNWHNLDLEKDSIPGMSVERAYSELLNGLKAKKVIVAVIDAGIDINHEDLNELIWVNKDEIPNNGIDDDKNGYVDDINGWNFLGESYNETLEMTRLIRDNLSENRRYDSALKTVKSKLDDRKKNIDFYNNLILQIENASEIIKTYLEKDSFSDQDLENIIYAKILLPINISFWEIQPAMRK